MNRTDQFRRRLIRTAAALQAGFGGQAAQPTVAEPPDSLWENLHTTYRQLDICQVKGFTGAARILQQQYLRQLDWLARQLQGLAASAQGSLQASPLPAFRLLYDELRALYDEFDHVEIDLRQGILAVQTERIVLEEIDLGPFSIRLNFRDLKTSHPYQVVPLDPRSSGARDETPHPHVSGNKLCEGEGTLAISTALKQGRLCDFFVIVRTILNTYNPDSAYVTLEDWEGVSCSDCSVTIPGDDASCCENCSSTICQECVRCCLACDDCLCGECSRSCESCLETFCSSCLAACDACDQLSCRNCLKSGLCPTCLEDQSEQEPHDTTPTESQAAAEAAAAPAPPEALETSGTEVHSDRLVEAAVPA